MNKEAKSTDKITIHIADNNGRKVEMKGVKAYRREGALYFDPIEAFRRMHDEAAAKAGLKEPRDLALISALGAPLGKIQMKQVSRVYHLNKLLFYQWVKMDRQGLGEAFPHDNFLKERKGPVPEHIWEDLERLERDGLLRIRWPTGAQHQPVPVELTPKGQAVFEALQPSLDADLLGLTAEVKAEILPMSPAELRDQVHEDFPQYKREWVEIDDS
jgi:hypothetical protein